MPRFKNPGAKEANQEKLNIVTRHRREVTTDLLLRALPTKEQDAMPKRATFQAALALYRADPESVTGDDPFFDTHKTHFISLKSFYTYWPDIKDILAERGIFIGYVRGKHGGVYRTRRKAVVKESFAFHAKIAKALAERYTYRAELTNQKLALQIPVMAVQMQLPPPVGS